MRGRERRWTDDEPRLAVAASTNLTDVLRALGLRAAGRDHRSVRGHVDRLALDTSHLSVARQVRGLRASGERRAHPPEAVFCRDGRVTRKVSRTHARRALLPYRRAACGNEGWHDGRPLTLHLEHANGVASDRLQPNLRWLCPNGHPPTATYTGRNAGGDALSRPRVGTPRRRPE